MFADLHIHTNISDATWDNTEILDKVKKKNISLFSITDHDRIDNSIRMIHELDGYNGCYVHGAEITSSYEGITYHITSYGFDYNDKALTKILNKNIDIWENFNNKVVEMLSKNNPYIDHIEHKEYEHIPHRGGWKTLNYLIDKNVISRIPEFFLLSKPLSNLLNYCQPAELIQTVKKAGGFTFLAHPNAYNKGRALPEEKLRNWIDLGISGIEVYSPYCTKKDSEYYADFCKRNNLQISGGSDCHGSLLPSRTIGSPVITKEMLNLSFT